MKLAVGESIKNAVGCGEAIRSLFNPADPGCPEVKRGGDSTGIFDAVTHCTEVNRSV